MTVPAWLVALGTLLAALAWLAFARSQRGRMQAGALAWLSLPFFIGTFIYAWFAIQDVQIEIRSIFGRVGFLMVAISQAFILTILSFLQRGNHRHGH